ncbi:hypothetical protein AK812_SmicGene43109 [Symbiodinium microadriaticum]|uniref:Uncharacterized protein n=1 Tax=Symbiodinium microadriaticum TaxID=2951 RepID=A0A1Q9C1U9_SYMMI|nr:hypothetical protein AK812_SmicGene43109 [Symbiodinium microadriaticum]
MACRLANLWPLRNAEAVLKAGIQAGPPSCKGAQAPSSKMDKLVPKAACSRLGVQVEQLKGRGPCALLRAPLKLERKEQRSNSVLSYNQAMPNNAFANTAEAECVQKHQADVLRGQ